MLLSLDKVANLTAGFREKILCFPSCLLFPSLVPVAFSLFSQSCSRCFLPVSSLSCYVPFILCAVMGSTDLGWSFVLAPSWFVSLDKKAGWLIAFLFPPSYVPVFFVVSIALTFFLGVSGWLETA
jgi:hypothetical protein